MPIPPLLVSKGPGGHVSMMYVNPLRHFRKCLGVSLFCKLAEDPEYIPSLVDASNLQHPNH